MKTKKMLFAAALALLAVGAHAASTTRAEMGEAKLAKMLEGRAAGKPQSCIPAQVSDRLQIIDETAIVYDAGETIYVARPDQPKSLDADDVLVINRSSGELCKQDVVRTVDQTSGVTTGLIFLGDFIPYRKG